MGTLYIVGAPAGDSDDLTFRARRILTEVGCVATCDPAWARRLLAAMSVEALVVATEDRAGIWDALGHGDVALLFSGILPGPSGPDLELIRTAIDLGVPVAPVPGPTLPITALVISGLPAGTFVFLGELSPQPTARRALLAAVAAERRTLVAVESPDRLPLTLADLSALLGDRRLAILTEAGQTWRGAVGEALEHVTPSQLSGKSVLVISGACEAATRWDEDRLRAEIAAGLDQGFPAKELSRHLAASSGWPRREIYRFAVDQAQCTSGR